MWIPARQPFHHLATLPPPPCQEVHSQSQKVLSALLPHKDHSQHVPAFPSSLEGISLSSHSDDPPPNNNEVARESLHHHYSDSSLQGQPLSLSSSSIVAHIKLPLSPTTSQDTFSQPVHPPSLSQGTLTQPVPPPFPSQDTLTQPNPPPPSPSQELYSQCDENHSLPPGGMTRIRTTPRCLLVSNYSTCLLFSTSHLSVVSPAALIVQPSIQASY